MRRIGDENKPISRPRIEGRYMDVILDSPSEENEQPVSDSSGGENKEEASDSERRVVSRRPARRTRAGGKKPARASRSRAASVDEEKEKPDVDAPDDTAEPAGTAAEVPEKRVVSRRPAKRSRASTKRTTRAKAGEKQQNQAGKEAEKTEEPAETAATAASEPADAAGESVAAPEAETSETATTPPADSAADAPAEAAAERAQESPGRGASPEHRRTRRRRQPRRQNDGGGGAESRDRAERIPQSVVEILSDAWTEEKARKYLSEGFLATLSAPLVSRKKVEEIDEEALRDRLKVVRRVLADECMVEDDASDLILLDMVINALADRLEVYRLSSRDASPEKLVHLVQLRYHADRRLIDTVTALKNA